jgi:hypothetical protein
MKTSRPSAIVSQSAHTASAVDGRLAPDAGVGQDDDSDYPRVLDKIAAVCREVSKGNFEARLINVKESDKLAAAQHAVNDMIDRCDAFVREASAAMDAVRQHKYYRRILREGLQGSLDIAAVIINDATVAIQKWVAAVRCQHGRIRGFDRNRGRRIVHGLDRHGRDRRHAQQRRVDDARAFHGSGGRH